MRFIKFLPLFILTLAMTTACSTPQKVASVITGSSSNKTTSKKLTSAQSDYTSAQKALKKGNYQTAIDEYSALILKHPFGAIAEQAQLDRIFAYERLPDTNSAVAAAESFISRYPNHENVDYAYYMKGVSQFKKKASFLAKTTKIQSNKNKSSLLASKAAFLELQQRFPNSQYIEDSKKRVLFLENEIAQQELATASFYKGRNAPIAAVNRYKYVIETYPDTDAAYDALINLRETYKEMGLIDAARDTNVAIKNNPKSKTLEKQEIGKKKGWSMPKLPKLFKKQ